MRKKWWIILLAILVLLMLLNPSMKQYKEYLGQDAGNLKRSSNFLVFSIFESQDDLYTKKHLGILSNFYLLNPNVHSYTPPVIDSPYVHPRDTIDY